MEQTHPVVLLDIEHLDRSKLSEKKLNDLQNRLSEALFNSSEPIALDKRFGKPYRITNGRHRIYLAREKGYQMVPAIFTDWL
ncbi:hypothetical protein [Scytonema sp. PCC 10023]|uniref:hypothetical protein n=1 Tax=Scytonema sp. PCC 10023 TaxID=1680591 RepID=UPI0039C70C09